MNLAGYLDFLRKIASLIPFNIFDLVLIVLFLIYVFEDASFGLVAAGIGFFSIISSFFVGLTFYLPLSKIVVKQFSLTKGISDSISFFIVTAISFVIISYVLSLIRKKYFRFSIPKAVDIIGGIIFGSLSFFFIASFIVALLLALPISKSVKTSINDSVSGKFLSSQVQRFDRDVRQIFGGAIEETINFLTVEPESNEAIALHFKTGSYKVDLEAESQMVALVNLERRKVGATELSIDERLTQVARIHAKDMLARGYFSHYTPEGLSPFDRMARANITYQYAGENLAFASDVDIAMEGLMKSPGHRANILSKNFVKIGIAALDAGVYGEIFVQEFTD